MDETQSAVVVELKVARRERRHQDDRARQVTVAFVAAGGYSRNITNSPCPRFGSPRNADAC